MSGLTYDTGALIAAENDPTGCSGRSTAPRSAEGSRRRFPPAYWGRHGGPQTRISRLLNACWVEPLTEAQARAVGVLAAKSGLDDTVDLAVAEGALQRNDVVLTSNRKDIERATHSIGRALAIHDVLTLPRNVLNSLCERSLRMTTETVTRHDGETLKTRVSPCRRR